MSWFRKLWLVAKLLLFLNNLKHGKGDIDMPDLTPNTEVGQIEKMGFSAGDLVYATILRSLLIEKIDDPNHVYDDRILAMADGAFAFKAE